MAFEDDYYEPPEPENRIGQVMIVENGFAVPKDYCTNCGSLNIRVSKRGNKYCGEICWKITNPTILTKIK